MQFEAVAEVHVWSCMAMPKFQTCAPVILPVVLPAGLVIPTAFR